MVYGSVSVSQLLVALTHTLLSLIRLLLQFHQLYNHTKHSGAENNLSINDL